MNDDGYELSDPKSPGYHDRMAEQADLHRKREKEDAHEYEYRQALLELQQVEAQIGEENAKHREAMRPFYDKRDRLAKQFAIVSGPAKLPRLSKQTDTQRKICPRCRQGWEEAA